MLKLSEKYKKFVKYAVAAILVIVTVYPKFPFINIPGTFVSIRLEDFILALGAAILSFSVITRLGSFLKKDIIRPIILFLAVGLLSLVSAIVLTKTVAIHIGLLHWVRRIEYFIPFFLAVLAIQFSKKNLEFYLKIILITILISFIYGLGQKYLNWPIIVTQNEEYSRGIALSYVPGGHINSTFAGHYDLGTYMVLVLPILISCFFTVKDKMLKILLIVSFSAGVWLLAHSGSRISVMSYLFSSTLALLVIKKYKAIPVLILLSFLIFSTSSNLVSRYKRIFEVTIDRIKSQAVLIVEPESVLAQEEIILPEKRIAATPTPTPIPVFEDRSTSIRLNVEWPRAIRAFIKNPLLGTGYSSMGLATDNDYLRLAGELGILGILSFFLVLVSVAKYIIKAFPIRKKFKNIELGYLGGYIGGTMGVLANAMFIDVFEASKFAVIFWLLTGIAVSINKFKLYE